MWQVFEDFLLEFYRVEQRQYRVGRPRIEWFEAEGRSYDLEHLPGMQTDIVLQGDEDCIIIDAKYYAEALADRFGSRKLRSGHLYQLFTYLENRTAEMPDLPHRGILLYPVVGSPISFDYRLKGQQISVRSIDLRQPWARIHEDILSIIRSPVDSPR